MPLGYREKPSWNLAECLSLPWLKCGESMAILVQHLGNSSWICTRNLFELGFLWQLLFCWFRNLKAKIKSVHSENPRRTSRTWSQMYMVLFLKEYLEKLVGSKCCLVTIQNTTIICSVEEVVTPIIHNPHRNNLVICQVSLNWLWPSRGQKRTFKAVRKNQPWCKWESEQLFI